MSNSTFNKAVAICAIGLAVISEAASKDADFDHPCKGKPSWVETEARFSDFDFWVGEWQVYNATSGEMRGFDVIEKDLEGCVLRQRWRHVDDSFSAPGLPWRFQGVSITGINAAGAWRQLWADNNGGNLLFEGERDEDGEMVLKSEWYMTPNKDGVMVRARSTWHWAPQDDGSIKNWGYIQSPDEKAEKRKYFDIVYRKNIIGSTAPQIR